MTITAQYAGAKYAGAGWLQGRRKAMLTPLSARISNVLGQVFSGIYHLTDSGSRRLDLLYESKPAYTLCVWGGLATTDSDTLTRLLLCCQAANLDVSIAGSRKGSLRFTFKDAGKVLTPSIDSLNLDFAALAESESDGNMSHPLVSGISKKSRLLSVHWNANDTISGFSIKSGAIDMRRLEEIVCGAHSACARAEIEGRCPTGNGQIRLYWTQRSRIATTIMEGHPTPEQAIDRLRPIWDIDYTRLDQ
ncbi:MAG: hypothetical protein ACRC62_01330 [Microcoleus sp.]